jgi:NAD(P)-dependent dehydrogenase (short-subunit alcohol dehydrogenase family)
VAVVSRTAGNVDEVVAAIRDQGGAAKGFVCDINRIDEVEHCVDAVLGAFGGVDILVNNAHDTRNINAAVLELSTEHVTSQMAGTLAALRFMQLCQPVMVARGGGRIVNMGSAGGVEGTALFAPYAMAKEAVRALTRCAAREWGREGITVNTVCPHALTEALQRAIDKGIAKAPRAAVGRYGSAKNDIAPIVLFLASDDSRFITGHTIMADGGMLIDAGR